MLPATSELHRETRWITHVLGVVGHSLLCELAPSLDGAGAIVGAVRRADLERVLAQRAEIVAGAAAALDADGLGSPKEMSRRQRWRLLGLDVRGDLAAVAVARRGKRTGLVIEAHRFRREEGAWVWDQIGPSSDFSEPVLPPRSTSGHNGCSEGATQGDVRTGDCVGLWLLVSEATRMRRDGRTRDVPAHGWVVTVDRASARSTEVLDVDGNVIGQLRIEEPRRIPRRFRAAMWWKRRRRPDADLWLNDTPDRHGR